MKKISVVIATFNRGRLLLDLLQGLAVQTLPPGDFEVIVVDDGSKEPVRPLIEAARFPFDLTILEQPNAGPAAARHRGILRAKGDVVVVLDDDMLVDPGFLAEHLRAHEAGGTLVLGHIADDEELGVRKPLFELFHARQLTGFLNALREGRIAPRGVHVCTGNVSFRRAAYLAAGGFDLSLPHSEDRELGVRLEKAGARLVFADGARSVHRSDRASLEGWFRRSFLYGVCDARIAKKHPDVPYADPWRYLFDVNPISRPLFLLTAAAPGVGRRIARAAMRVAMGVEMLGAERAALAGATLAYGLEYIRGVRSEAGSLRATARGLYEYLKKR
jgi:glycosyltransferase involved in cell wall biosynthesis